MTLTEKKSGELFAEFVKIEPPSNKEEDVYEKWVKDKLVPAVRESLVGWNLPVPSGIQKKDGKPAATWAEARWQDVLKRGIVGIHFRDKVYAPSKTRLKRIDVLLKSQGAKEDQASDYLFYLAYSLHLSLLPTDLTKLLPLDFTSKHDFLKDSWDNGRFHGSTQADVSISGNLFALPSEVAHLLEALIKINKGAGYKLFTKNPELEDRLGVLALQKVLPYLTYPEAQDYVFQLTELGRLLAEDQKESPKTLAFLEKWEIVSEGKRGQLKVLYEAGKTEEVAKKFTPSEIYYLGVAASHDPKILKHSAPRVRMKEIKASLEKVGAWRGFQAEIDQTVGILPLQHDRITFLKDRMLKPYTPYNSDDRHKIAERHSVDFIVHLVRLSQKEGISPGAQPFLIIKGIRYLYENGDSTKSVPENIQAIDGALIKKWVQELKDDGTLKEGAPMSGKDRLLLRKIYNERKKINEFALFIDKNHGLKRGEQLPNMDVTFGFVFMGILGLIGLAEKREKETRKQLLIIILNMETPRLLEFALSVVDYPRSPVFLGAKAELIRRIIQPEMAFEFKKGGLRPENFSEFVGQLETQVNLGFHGGYSETGFIQ